MSVAQPEPFGFHCAAAMERAKGPALPLSFGKVLELAAIALI